MKEPEIMMQNVVNTNCDKQFKKNKWIEHFNLESS